MQISVKLFGGLRQYLPAGSSFNGCNLTVGDDAILPDVLALLPIPSDKSYLVILNDAKVDRADYAAIKVSAADDIVLLPPIKGG